MSTIIKFPQTDNSRQRLNNRKVESQDSKEEKKVLFTPVYVHGLSETKNKLDDINDTLKYVTDGLYTIALELREIRIRKPFWFKLMNFFHWQK